jgi:hypothetical protein
MDLMTLMTAMGVLVVTMTRGYAHFLYGHHG